jgi:hypothetical protein
MGKLTKARYADLDALIADRGEDWMLEQIVDGIAEGVSHSDLACRLGLKWWVIRKWIEANCAEDVAAAYRARADLMSDQATGIAVGAQSETLAVDKFQAEFWMKMAAKADRIKYGESTQLAITTTHTMDIRGLLDQRESRLKSLNKPIEGEAIEIMESVCGDLVHRVESNTENNHHEGIEL